jgi:hypothetical protein
MNANNPKNASNPREPYVVAGVLFLFSFLFFYLSRIPTPLNVDTYIYAHAIGSFEGPIIHLGYYGIGALCYSFLKFFGVSPLQTLGYISQFCGGVCVGGMYIFTFLLTKSRLHSLLSAVILMFSGAVWFYSIHGEVYVPQLAFVLLSMICLLKGLPLLSSLFILIAISITPTSLLALIPAGYFMHMRRFSKQDVIGFTVPILLASVLVIWWDGPRVIKTFEEAIYPATIFFDEFSYSRMAVNVVYRLAYTYGRSFNFISLFAVIGFFALHRHDKKVWGAMLSFLLPFLTYFLNLGLFSPDHLIITSIAVSFLGAYAIQAILDGITSHVAARFVSISLLVLLFSWISFEFLISRQKIYSAELDRVIHKLSEQDNNRGVMLADYNFGVSFWTLTHKVESKDLLEGRPHVFLEENTLDRQTARKSLKGPFWVSFAGIRGFASLPELKTLMEERPIYLVERIDWPIGCVQVFKDWLVGLGLVKQEEVDLRLEKFSEYLSYKLDTDITTKKIIESPLHPVYLLEPHHNNPPYRNQY